MPTEASDYLNSLTDSLSKVSSIGKTQTASSWMVLLWMVVAAIGIFIAFWIAALIVRLIIVRAGKTRKLDEHLMRFLGRAAYTTLLLIGLITALAKLGVNVTALVAGLGLTGFAIGFALKDVISNALAGILIIIYKPFRHGDCIKVATFEGEVLEIDLRYTKLDALEQEIFLPNSLLFSNAVTIVHRIKEPPMEGSQA